MSNAIRFPALYIPLFSSFGVAGGGFVYIGLEDEDPTVEANRIDVDILEEDGTETTIPGAQQPFDLSAGGVVTYQGAPVQLLADGSYSMTIQSALTSQIYYFPRVSPISSSNINMTPLDDDPTPNGSIQIYAKLVDGVPQLFIMDGDGNITQVSSETGLQLPETYPFPVQADDPDPVADTMVTYSKVVNGNLELFVVDPNGNEIQLTNDGNVNAGEGSTVSVSGTAYTITNANLGQALLFDEADTITITVPEEATEVISAGFYFLAKNEGVGQIVIATEGSDTLDGISVLARPDLWTTVLLEEAGSPNDWGFIGNDWVPTSVKDASLTAPPGTTPNVGDVYVVAATATGSWAGQEDNFAIHVGSDVYEFQSPDNSILCYDENAGSWIGWTGDAWVGSSFGTDYPAITTEAGTGLTVTNAMAGNLIVFDSASDCILTLPETSTEELAEGFEVSVIQLGAGNLFIAFEGSDTHTGVRMVQTPKEPTRIKKMTAGSPNDWQIFNNSWLIGTLADWTTTAPPATPANGTIYYVDGAGSGAWSAANRDFVIHVGGGVYDVQEPVLRYQDFFNQVNTKRETLDTTNGTTYASN